MLNFLEPGVYGRLGCAGLAAIKARQAERSKDLTPEILSNFADLVENFQGGLCHALDL